MLGYAGARRSVSQTDLSKYDSFRMKFDPIYKSQAAWGDGTIIVDWPNTDGAATDVVRGLPSDMCIHSCTLFSFLLNWDSLGILLRI